MPYPPVTMANVQNNMTAAYQTPAGSYGAQTTGMYGNGPAVEANWVNYGYGYDSGGQYPAAAMRQQGYYGQAAGYGQNFNMGHQSEGYASNLHRPAPPPPPPPPPPQQPPQPFPRPDFPRSQAPRGTISLPITGTIRPAAAPPPQPPPRPVEIPPITLPCPPMPPTFPWVCAAMYSPFNCGDTIGSGSVNGEEDLWPPAPVVVRKDDTMRLNPNIRNQTEELKPNLADSAIEPRLPKILRDMFQPLYCKLCTLALSSPVVAMDHYKGKKHKRKIEVWFEENPKYVVQNKPTGPGPSGVTNHQPQNDTGPGGPRPATWNPGAGGPQNPNSFSQNFNNLERPNFHNPDNQGTPNPWNTKSAPQGQNQSRNFGGPSGDRNNLKPPRGHAVHGPGKPPGGKQLSGANAIPLGGAPGAGRIFRNSQGPPVRPQGPDGGRRSDLKPPPRQNNEIKPLMSLPVRNPIEENPVVQNQTDFGNNPRPNGAQGRQGQFPGNKRAPGPNQNQGPPPKKEKPDTGGPVFCNVCNISLSSQVTADQHFAGKRHKEALLNRQKTGNFELADRSFGIGKGFRPNNTPDGSSCENENK